MQYPITMAQRHAWLTSLALVLGLLASCAQTPPAPPPAPTPETSVNTPAAPERNFTQWIATVQDEARAAGIREATLHMAFDNVRYLPRIVDSDRAQPEFTRTVWDYLDRAVSPQRVTLGRDKLQKNRRPAQAASARYGVPASVLAAIWGVESNFGTAFGDIPVIDALATLGFEGRREAWARAQLLDALRILQNGDITRAQMVGSWAGAMGQTQFIPSVFLAHAVDADGDGRRDIWGSMADVFASTANFVAHSGWQKEQAWGAEVRFPIGFDFERIADKMPTPQWAALGVKSMDGAPLPALGNEAAILLPAGARGPAFLVGTNFRAILRYNNSTSYALAVCLLAQRLDNGPAVLANWPRELRALSRSEVQTLQTALSQRGFETGKPDGVLGPATQAGIRHYQRSEGLVPDGFADTSLLQRLSLAAAE